MMKWGVAAGKRVPLNGSLLSRVDRSNPIMGASVMNAAP